MNYKRIVIFFTFILAAAAFGIAGNRFGNSSNTAKQKVYAASDKRETKESNKIAVVNLDEGVSGREGRVNYGERLSRFPSMDFEYSSLEAARYGLETGRYGAYVIIPATFSQNVESINASPQVSKLEYAVNQSYSGKRQYELLYNIWSYIDSLNNHLSYMYVDNILREFHDAQDQAEYVMENDLEDIRAIEKIRTQELVTLAKSPQMPMDEAKPELLDISFYTAQSVMLAESLDAQYENCIQNIQTNIASLNAGKNTLSESLKELTEQVGGLNLLVDQNGEEIAKKAEEGLRTELKRQSENMLDKEMMIEHLKRLRDNQEEFIKSFEQSNRIEILYDEQKQPVLDSGEQPSLVLPFLTEQNQELDYLLAELEQAEEPDLESIIEIIRAEYVNPMEANADQAKKEFQQRYEDELLAVSLYHEQLAAFHPQMNSLFRLQSIQELEENHRNMQNALLENNQAYMEYAQKIAATSREYADGLQKHAAEVRQEAEKAIEEGLSFAKEVKEKNSAMNQRILRNFSLKLPYTRLGSAEYTRVYQFIANPISAVDKSDN
jgi:hypothetical protein